MESQRKISVLTDSCAWKVFESDQAAGLCATLRMKRLASNLENQGQKAYK